MKLEAKADGQIRTDLEGPMGPYLMDAVVLVVMSLQKSREGGVVVMTENHSKDGSMAVMEKARAISKAFALEEETRCLISVRTDPSKHDCESRLRVDALTRMSSKIAPMVKTRRERCGAMK